MACKCKKRCNETCLCGANDLKCTGMFLCHGCGSCEEILYEEKGETEFDSDDENDEEECFSDRSFNTFICMYIFK